MSKTRSAPSSRSRRCAGWSSCRATVVISASTGRVPEWLATTRAPPVAGHVLQALRLDPEPLLEQRPQDRQQDVVGEVGVEAELVGLVLAGQPAAQELQPLGELVLPAGRGGGRDVGLVVVGTQRDDAGLRHRAPPAVRAPGARAAAGRRRRRRCRRPARGPTGRRTVADSDQPGGHHRGHRAGVVGQRGLRRVAGGVAELLAQHRGVHDAAEVEEAHLLRRVVDEPEAAGQPADRAERRRGDRQLDAAEPADRLRQQQGALAADVHRADEVAGGRAGEHRQGVVLVQELHAGVVAERGGHDRHAEEAGEHRVDPRTDEVGEPQRRDVDVGTAPGEGAHVALDVEAVLGEPARGDARGPASSR